MNKVLEEVKEKGGQTLQTKGTARMVCVLVRKVKEAPGNRIRNRSGLSWRGKEE